MLYKKYFMKAEINFKSCLNSFWPFINIPKDNSAITVNKILDGALLNNAKNIVNAFARFFSGNYILSNPVNTNSNISLCNIVINVFRL